MSTYPPKTVVALTADNESDQTLDSSSTQGRQVSPYDGTVTAYSAPRTMQRGDWKKAVRPVQDTRGVAVESSDSSSSSSFVESESDTDPFATPVSVYVADERDVYSSPPSAYSSIEQRPSASSYSRSSSINHHPPSPIGSTASDPFFPTGAISADSPANDMKVPGPYANPPSGHVSSSIDRPAPQGLKRTPFPPCALLSGSNRLEHGFPVYPPTTDTQPHPFATHDVNAADWSEFLAEVKAAASPTSMDKVVPGIAVIGITGFLVSRGIKSRSKKRKIANVAHTADRWNQKFFHPRQMEITLARGQERYSGQGGGLPPDTAATGGLPRESSAQNEDSIENRQMDEDADKHWRLVVSYR